MSRRRNSKPRKPSTNSTQFNQKDKNGGKPFLKGKDDEYKSTTNDPSWYATDPALLRDVASFPFSRPAGTLTGYDYNHYNRGSRPEADAGFNTMSVPGIYKVVLNATCGLSQDATSAVNVAAQSMYSFVRHANSGHANYEMCDLMIYMLANSNVYGFINWAQRVYGTALMYSQRNRWVPKFLLESDGIDFEDVISNLANFRYGINLLVNKASSLAVPSSFTLFNRHAFLYQNYYIEGDSVKDQIYYFAPSSFFYFALNDDDSSGELRPGNTLDGVDFLNRSYQNKLTVSDILKYGNALINAILEQEDFGIMSGDILKAYGDNIVKLTSLDEVYSLQFIKDDYVLLQFKNCTPILTDQAVFGGQNIYQKDGIIIYEPTIQMANRAFAETMYDIFIQPKPITFNKTDVSNEDVIEGTRLMMGLQENKITYNHPLIVHGSEICLSASGYRISFGGTVNSAHLVEYPAPYVKNMSTIADWADCFFNMGSLASVLSAFRFHNSVMPTFSVAGTGGAPDYWYSPGPMYDFDNYTMISCDELERMHDACLFNMLHVPAVAKANQK